MSKSDSYLSNLYQASQNEIWRTVTVKFSAAGALYCFQISVNVGLSSDVVMAVSWASIDISCGIPEVSINLGQ